MRHDRPRYPFAGFTAAGAGRCHGPPESGRTILPDWYWSGTEYANNPNNAWNFDTNDGNQNANNKDNNNYALAVRPG